MMMLRQKRKKRRKKKKRRKAKKENGSCGIVYTPAVSIVAESGSISQSLPQIVPPVLQQVVVLVDLSKGQ